MLTLPLAFVILDIAHDGKSPGQNVDVPHRLKSDMVSVEGSGDPAHSRKVLCIQWGCVGKSALSNWRLSISSSRETLW